MVSRCENPKNAVFNHYGARGICVCPRWKDFNKFLADMGVQPKGWSIERVNNDGDYEPGNCKWIPRGDQAKNTRAVCLLTHDGRTQSLSDWAREMGMDRRTIGYRLKNGWPVAKALTQPIRRKA